MTPLKIKYATMSDVAKEPTQGTPFAAGHDLYVGALPNGETIIAPGEVKKIPTDLIIELPNNAFGAVYPRSGLATKKGLRLANGVAVIDPDYRGIILVPLYNDSDKPHTVKTGDRIAQMVIQPFFTAQFTKVSVDELTETERQDKGFGSTGKR